MKMLQRLVLAVAVFALGMAFGLQCMAGTDLAADEIEIRVNGTNYDVQFAVAAGELVHYANDDTSVVSNLGLSGTSLLYRWKSKVLETSGPTATKLEARVGQLEAELRRVRQERDILKKALPENLWVDSGRVGDLRSGFLRYGRAKRMEFFPEIQG